MLVDKFIANFPEYEVTPLQLACARYLETTGMRFLVDFGFGNAEAKIWSQFERVNDENEITYYVVQ